MTEPPVETPAHVDLTPLEGGRYQLLEVIGTGGMATVYRAWDERLQVTRAVKILSPQLYRNTTIRHRFETEARTMARLYHPHIVGVHDVGVDGERVYIVMELVAGGSLMDHVSANGSMPVKMATEALLSLMHALKAAHSSGVVHRDIKPHNIMVDHNGVLKVGDFGIAHVADENMSMTKTGSVMGTWGYMAPEQRASARDVDARADLYSAAATWYTLMTNQLPSDLFAVDLDETMFQAVPESVQALMRRATRYKPEDRFEDSEAMIAAVEELLETLPEDSGQYPRPGADLDEDSLGIGRRGATIVPHSDSTERSESRSAPTYAGGVLSERIEGGPLMAPAGVSGTLFDGEDDEEVESTDFRIGRKNRIAFGLGMLVTLGVGATLLFGPERADEAVDGAQNVIEDNGQEALRSASLDEASGSTVAESSLPSVSPDSEKMAGEPTPADSLPEAAPASKTVVETEAVQAESSETVEEDNSGSEIEPAVVRPRGQRVRNRIRNRVETRLGADNSPAQLTYLSSVPVRGAVEALQVCYLVSQETGKRFQMPFNRIPGGTYTLRYKFSGAQGGVRDAATLLEVAEGTTPRIRCLARTGVCTVAN